MDNVNRTLYIPLYGKALVSRRGIILADKKAETIWENEGFPLKGKSRSKWLAYYMAMRSAVFDRWLAERLGADPEAAVLHIGCGMDNRVGRVGMRGHRWYDIDFPEVTELRRKYYAETDGYSILAGDARRTEWLDSIEEHGSAAVVLEGICMYLSGDELKGLLCALGRHFGKVSLLMDVYTERGARATAYKNPINDVGVTEVYGTDDPEFPENGTGFKFVREHDMTPPDMINELKGAEKAFFRLMFAGRFARSIYRMYEYRKDI